MTGTHKLIIQSAHLKYEMVFSRNLTIIQGNSATGKTTLVDMIQEYNLNGSDTGIMMQCDCPVRIIAGNNWREQLSLIERSIVVIDEGNRFVATKDFADAIQGTDNYYVIITRESLDTLPYSVTEIYAIRSSGKFQSMEPVYHHMERIYGNFEPNEAATVNSVIVEDSNAGYEFFRAILKGSGPDITSAGGSGRIFEKLQSNATSEGCMVIADGAAFGSQMNRIYQLMLRNSNIHLYLPESFEWLILSSDILNDAEVRRILQNPSDYIDSQNYVSWERYFTALLVGRSQKTPFVYNKRKLNPSFIKGKACDKILRALPEAIQAISRNATEQES